jgi:hypothetical protein
MDWCEAGPDPLLLHLKLINTVEATAAKALPPGLPLHTNTEMDARNLANAGFTPGKNVTTSIK